ncbi:hypothetical protein [Persephonella sp.]|uniref:gp53-like domain-containing protein n=1 Tax=Persephonella sp. TaxID=2060922 RepID=UPI002636EEBC|nr:hypothetical protein [Persephonella sp.]
MADWNNPNPINTNPSGDTVYQGFGKAENNFNDLYSKLNQVKKLQTGTTAPSNPAVGELWFDENTGILKRYDGTNWVEIARVGRDALTLEGLRAYQFLRSDVPTQLNTDSNWFPFIINSTSPDPNAPDSIGLSIYPEKDQSRRVEYSSKKDGNFRIYLSAYNGNFLESDFAGQNLFVAGKKIWHEGNDGAGSGLDADLVRGLPADFSSSNNPNGYQKLPSGVIIQWGTFSLDGGPFTGHFPIAFPNACVSVVATDVGNGVHSLGISPNDNATFSAWASAYPTTARYIAIGY